MKFKPYEKKTDYSLVNYIQDKLNKHWSPNQISSRIIIDRPDKKIAFSSIYNWLYNGVLNKCSAELLRRKEKSLKPK